MTRELYIHVHPDKRGIANFLKALHDEEGELEHVVEASDLVPRDQIFIVDLAKFEDVSATFARELGTNLTEGA